MIADLRREYASRSLSEADTLPDPLAQFKVWFEEALKSQVIDVNAMSLATASAEGEPSVRTVLLKGVDEGFLFFTHYTSPKGRDLAENPRAALLFYWAELERQVRISGVVERVGRDVSEAYFATRPPESQWAVWAARQSSTLPDRATLERGFAEAKQRYSAVPIPCPPEWGGYRVTPARMEFWQGRPGRLHDRLLYVRHTQGTWERTRLAP